MGVIKALKTSWKVNLKQIEKKIIKKIEKDTNKPATPKQRKKAHKKAKKILFRRIRKRIGTSTALAFGIIGITAGAAGLLNEGQTSVESNTGIESENNQKTKKEAYFEELKVEVDKYLKGLENDPNDTINLIFDGYNNNLSEDFKIKKEDLSVIKQENMGEAHVIEKTSGENGEEVSYIVNPLEKGPLPEGSEFLEAKDIGTIYAVVDTAHNTTVAGVGEINGEYKNVDIVNISCDGKEYTMNIKTYAGLSSDIDVSEAFESISEYYEYKINSDKLQEKAEEMKTTEEKNNEGFEH